MKAGPSNGKLYTEEDWNTESGPDKEGGYMYSKVVYLLMLLCFAILMFCQVLPVVNVLFTQVVKHVPWQPEP